MRLGACLLEAGFQVVLQHHPSPLSCICAGRTLQEDASL